MPFKIEIIISRCDKTGRTIGNTIRETFSSGFSGFFREPENMTGFEEDRRQYADPYRREGFSVIVRPCYNQPDGKGFYEWRSFHGGDWEYCHWSIP